MTRRGIVLLTLLGVAAGCGPTLRYVYDKPGVSREQRSNELTECESLALLTPPSRGYSSHGSLLRSDREQFNRCMRERGYDVREIEQ